MDADNGKQQLGWSFVQTDLSSDVILINGLFPIQDLSYATSPSVVGQNLRDAGAASDFDIQDTSDNTAGTGASLPGPYTGTNVAPAISSAGMATTITLIVSDGWNKTQKTILVVSNASTDDFTSGVKLDEGSFTNGASHSSQDWSVWTEFDSGGAAGNLLVTLETDGYNFLNHTVGDMVVVKSAHSSMPHDPLTGLANPSFQVLATIEKGKMYRVSTHIAAAGAGPTLVPWFFLKLGHSTGNYDVASAFEFLGNDASQGNMSPSASGGLDYEALYCPPQESRLDGITYGSGVNNLRVSYKVTGLGPDIGALFDWQAYGGSLLFSNTQVDELEAPGIGSNGYVARWGNDADTGDNFSVGVTHLQDSACEDWGYWAQALAGSVWYDHNDLPGGSSLVTDAVCSTTLGTGHAESMGKTDSIEIYGNISDGTNCWWINGDPNGNGNNDQSAVDYDILHALSDTVYYRAVFSVWSTNLPWDAGDPLYQPWLADVIKNNPITRLRCGWPWGTYSAETWVEGNSLNPYFTVFGRAGPVASEVTNYFTMIKGLPASAEDANAEFNNFFLTFQVIGPTQDMGGTVVLDEAAVEAFPTSWF
jgi:hypothetical protein